MKAEPTALPALAVPAMAGFRLHRRRTWPRPQVRDVGLRDSVLRRGSAFGRDARLRARAGSLIGLRSTVPDWSSRGGADKMDLEINVLIVDDEPSFSRQVIRYLEYDGARRHGLICKCRSATDWEQAVSQVESGFNPHILVLDNDFTEQGLREDAGFEEFLPRVHSLRAQNHMLDAKIVCISGKLKEQDIEGVRESVRLWGADEFLHKEGLISSDHLAATIKSLLTP